jgi:hypothetical protein
MTTKAITGGFAVCETRLGAKIHDPKDPGADLGPMFSQVVSTILRLTVKHADHWLAVRGSHPVPTYGFERYADPPPLDVDVARLLGAFARGRVALGDTWQTLVTPAHLSAIDSLATEAGSALDEITRSDTPTTADDVSFHFPDELWASVIHDLALVARDPSRDMDRMIAALVPIYFGRVASLVIEAREMNPQQFEALVERQARAYELAKSDLVERWNAGEGLKPRKKRTGSGKRAPGTRGKTRSKGA